MSGRNFWLAIGAVGTLLGGAAALIAVLKPIGFGSQTASNAPTYSEAIWCAAEAGHIEIPVRWISEGGLTVPASVQTALPDLAAIQGGAHAQAVRLASSEEKSASDVEGEIAELRMLITLRDYSTQQQQAEGTAQILARKAAAVLTRCQAFGRT